MFFNLLLANKFIMFLLFFFLLFYYFFIVPVVKDLHYKSKLAKLAKSKLALAISTGAQISLAKQIIDIPPLVVGNSIKDLSKQSKSAMYLLSFLLIIFLSLRIKIVFQIIDLI